MSVHIGQHICWYDTSVTGYYNEFKAALFRPFPNYSVSIPFLRQVIRAINSLVNYYCESLDRKRSPSLPPSWRWCSGLRYDQQLAGQPSPNTPRKGMCRRALTSGKVSPDASFTSSLTHFGENCIFYFQLTGDSSAWQLQVWEVDLFSCGTCGGSRPAGRITWKWDFQLNSF